MAAGLAGCAATPAAPPAPLAASGFPAAPGGAFRDQPFAPEMVVIPGGAYVMGSSEAETTREKRAPAAAAFERPQHEVAVAPVAIGRFHVTRAEFDGFVKATGRTGLGNCIVNKAGKWGPEPKRSYLDTLFPQGPRHPAVCVTWDEARAYAEWLSQQTGHRYRLIRETEWEYAARAGATTARWWGDEPGDLCRRVNGGDLSYDKGSPGDPNTNRACDDGFFGTNPVDHFPANPFGLHDMFGNAWQWMADCFRDRYDAPMPAEDDCKRRAIRGGSWHNPPNNLRAANRFWLAPSTRSTSIGFRVAREADALTQ
jgi:formylglycine-generating enzyme